MREKGVRFAKIRCKLAHAFLWEYSYTRLKSAQRLGQLGVLLALKASKKAIAGRRWARVFEKTASSRAAVASFSSVATLTATILPSHRR